MHKWGVHLKHFTMQIHEIDYGGVLLLTSIITTLYPQDYHYQFVFPKMHLTDIRGHLHAPSKSSKTIFSHFPLCIMKIPDIFSNYIFSDFYIDIITYNSWARAPRMTSLTLPTAQRIISATWYSPSRLIDSHGIMGKISWKMM